ncbi:MAG: SRPBCC family protein [Planctomycetaceae bacterium]|nr:SRPBCC family protein [Planctomycetaceae bacterium]
MSDSFSTDVRISKHPDKAGFLLETTQLLSGSLTEVFEFFSDAMQLETITPKWLHFHVTTPRPIVIQEGTLIDYRLKLRGIPIKWRTRISEWAPPFRFVDEQLRGPYLWWHHTHYFEQVGNYVKMTDRVHYGVPGGRFVHWLCVKNDVKRIFEYRQTQMKKLFPIDDV